MRKSVWGVVLIMIAIAFSACSMGDTPVGCYDNSDWVCDRMEKWNHGDEEVDLVCNMAATLEDACDALLAELPEGDYELPDFCNYLDSMGTCQPIGIEGAVCAEDDDCESGKCTDDQCEPAEGGSIL